MINQETGKQVRLKKGDKFYYDESNHTLTIGRPGVLSGLRWYDPNADSPNRDTDNKVYRNESQVIDMMHAITCALGLKLREVEQTDASTRLHDHRIWELV